MESATSTSRGNYRRYTRQQKEAAVRMASEHSFRHASKELNIPRSTILEWKKHLEAGTMGVKKMTGRKLTYDVETDLRIRDWVLEQRARHLPVTRASICEFAMKVVQKPNFKASEGWVTAFMKRHDLSIRTKTSAAQRLPEDLDERIDIFQQHIREERLHTQFHPDCVLNMDETAVFFDLLPSRTVAKKGEKAVIVRSTGAEKRHLTVALAITAQGNTLPPLVIFKGKRWPSDIKEVPEVLHVRMQEKGWMTEDLMVAWLDSIVRPFTQDRPSLLVMDSFAGHTTPAVREKMEQMSVTPAIIPGGCTSKIQPLDVSINKPFKDHLRKSWTAYMRDTDTGDGSKIPTASRQHILGWVKDAWQAITANPDMVSRSFEACGISQTLASAEERLRRNEDVLRAALGEDSTSSFPGFTPEDVPDAFLDSDSRDPFQL